MGLQAVSGLLKDGRAERARIVVAGVDAGGIPVIPPEDLIADRAAQALVLSGATAEAMRDQCTRLYLVSENLDLVYLNKRIMEESAGDASLATLEAWADGVHHPR